MLQYRKPSVWREKMANEKMNYGSPEPAYLHIPVLA